MKIEAYWDLNALSQIKSPREAAKAFEEEFLRIYLKEARKSVKPQGFLGNSFASKIYLDMFDMQIAKALSDGGGLGIEEYIRNALESYGKNSK